ncbi:MAG TPA: hypothetical protein VLH08_04980, partial [Acidobacteriota bacterium]|nr:hypothetical protein [Acidobacteriota bacterium]
MPKISGPTAQQTVSSSTMLMEEPVVSKSDVKTGSKTETPSHSEAQKQNAVARQGDNNLTAMLQRDRIAESPRAYIPKEDVDYLAKALTSKP